MAYSIYDRKRTHTTPLAVTIIACGRICLNAAASRILQRNGVKRVLLLYDAVERKIALRSISRNDRRAYAVTYSPVVKQAQVHGSCFLLNIGWDRGNYYRLYADWDGEYDTLAFIVPQWGNQDKQKVVTLHPDTQQAG